MALVYMQEAVDLKKVRNTKEKAAPCYVDILGDILKKDGNNRNHAECVFVCMIICTEHPLHNPHPVPHTLCLCFFRHLHDSTLFFGLNNLHLLTMWLLGVVVKEVCSNKG